MKKVFILVAFILIGTLVSAQITATDGLGNPVNTGYEFISNTTGEGAELDVVVTNNASGTVNLYLVCNQINGSDGSAMEYCFGINCFYGITVGETKGPLTLEAGASSGNGYVHFVNHDETSDYMNYDFTIYEEGNESNAISFSYIYDVNASSSTDLQDAANSIYPNPANDYISFRTKSAFVNNVIIYDMYGKQVLHKPSLKAAEKIDISHLPKGFYIVKYDSSLEKNISEKIIVQ